MLMAWKPENGSIRCAPSCNRGADRATFLLEKLTEEARHAGVCAPLSLNTPYVKQEERPVILSILS
jgi:hypothetical protein